MVWRLPITFNLAKLASEVWIMKGVFSVSPKLNPNQTQSCGQGIVAARSYLIGRESWEASWAEYDKEQSLFPYSCYECEACSIINNMNG